MSEEILVDVERAAEALQELRSAWSEWRESLGGMRAGLWPNDRIKNADAAVLRAFGAIRSAASQPKEPAGFVDSTHTGWLTKKISGTLRLHTSREKARRACWAEKNTRYLGAATIILHRADAPWENDDEEIARPSEPEGPAQGETVDVAAIGPEQPAQEGTRRVGAEIEPAPRPSAPRPLDAEGERLVNGLCGCSWLMQIPERGFVVERDRVKMRALLSEYLARHEAEVAEKMDAVADDLGAKANAARGRYDRDASPYDEGMGDAYDLAEQVARKCAAALRARFAKGGE